MLPIRCELQNSGKLIRQYGGYQLSRVVFAQLADKELLKQFQQVELLSPEDKHLVKTFIDAFLTKRHIQELAK
jgi:hypothetical protein